MCKSTRAFVSFSASPIHVVFIRVVRELHVLQQLRTRFALGNNKLGVSPP